VSISLMDLWGLPAAQCGSPEAKAPPYLSHAIDPDRPAAAAVRLEMHGEIRLGKSWRAFRGEEVIHRECGFLWKAKTGLVWGVDSLVDGVGRSTWKLMGLLPLVDARGSDIDRSATGCWLAESLLLPSMLLPEAGALWVGSQVTLKGFGEYATLNLSLSRLGQLRSFVLQRWGNPGKRPFGYYPFGGFVEAEGRFDGYTIPTRLTLGWHFGSSLWEEGQFFRMSIQRAEFH